MNNTVKKLNAFKELYDTWISQGIHKAVGWLISGMIIASFIFVFTGLSAMKNYPKIEKEIKSNTGRLDCIDKRIEKDSIRLELFKMQLLEQNKSLILGQDIMLKAFGLKRPDK